MMGVGVNSEWAGVAGAGGSRIHNALFQDSQKICDLCEEGKSCGNVVLLLVFESHGKKLNISKFFMH